MRTPYRWTVAVTLAALTLTACGSDLPILEDLPAIPGISDSTDGPTDPDDPGQSGNGDGGAGDPGSDPGGAGGTEGSGGSGGSGDPPQGTAAPQPPGQLTPANDAGGVGANGRAILRGDRSSLVIEIDVQEGARVDDAAVQHTVDTLRQVTDKATIRLGGGGTFSSDRRSWSTADVRNAAATHRSTSTTNDEVSIHVLYLRGGHVDGNGNQTNAIGIAYSASTIALFPDRWSDLTGVLGSSRAIERAVFLHEVGHLLGLVNLTYTSDINHEDPAYPGHSRHRTSVMYHAVETTLVGQVFSGPPPDQFHADDLADLEGLRTGRY